MRWVLALVLAAAAVAIAAGLALPADAIKVGTSSLSSSGLADEMAAISNSPSWQCYVQATYFVDSKGGTAPAVPGATAQTWSNAASRLWSSIRTPQLSQVQFVQAHDPAAFSQASLAQAKLSLEERIYATIAQAFQSSTQAASYTCPAAAGGAKTLESMPPWFVDAQVRAEAARIGMLALLPNPVPEGGPALAAWYRTHAGEFDTTCVADIIVGSLPLAEYIQAQLHAGHPLAPLVQRYSGDVTTKPRGGQIGCFAPTSPSWSNVLTYVGSTPLGQAGIFPSGQGQYYLFIPTKRTPNAFATIASAVASQAVTTNELAVRLLTGALLQLSLIHI